MTSRLTVSASLSCRMTNRGARLGAVLLLAALHLTLAGCATDKPMEAKRLETISSLEVVRYPTPEIQRHSGDTIAGGGLLFGGFGMEALATNAGKQLRERCNLEDFGALVTREFTEQAPHQFPTWPSARIRESPIEPGYATRDAYVLSFQPGMVWLYSFGPKGLLASMTATLVSPSGEEIWRFTSSYSSKEAGRMRELEELEADSCRLLKEEMHHAARVMAAQFVANLSGPPR